MVSLSVKSDWAGVQVWAMLKLEINLVQLWNHGSLHQMLL